MFSQVDRIANDDAALADDNENCWIDQTLFTRYIRCWLSRGRKSIFRCRIAFSLSRCFGGENSRVSPKLSGFGSCMRDLCVRTFFFGPRRKYYSKELAHIHALNYKKIQNLIGYFYCIVSGDTWNRFSEWWKRSKKGEIAHECRKCRLIIYQKATKMYFLSIVSCCVIYSRNVGQRPTAIRAAFFNPLSATFCALHTKNVNS